MLGSVPDTLVQLKPPSMERSTLLAASYPLIVTQSSKGLVSLTVMLDRALPVLPVIAPTGTVIQFEPPLSVRYNVSYVAA